MDTRHAVRLFALLLSGLLFGSCTSSDESVPPYVTSNFALRDELRQLWTEEATWTRVVVVSSVAGLEDTPVATERLLRNGADIADAFRPFYGDEFAYRLTALMNDHVGGTLEVIAAVLAADNAALSAGTTFWYANADALARFLADANPAWSYYDLYRAFSAQLDEMLAETMARASGAWDDDVAAHDALVRQEDEIADVLTTGITVQFPALVSSATFMSHAELDLHLRMRALGEDQAGWMRFFLVDSLAGLPSTPETEARLIRVEDEVANELRQYYGNTPADELTVLLHEHVGIAGELSASLVAGDTNGAGIAESKWHENAAATAQFFAELDPGWSYWALLPLLDARVEHATEQAVSRARGDWESDVTAYDHSVANELVLSDTLSARMSSLTPTPGPFAI